MKIDTLSKIIYWGIVINGLIIYWIVPGLTIAHYWILVITLMCAILALISIRKPKQGGKKK